MQYNMDNYMTYNGHPRKFTNWLFNTVMWWLYTGSLKLFTWRGQMSISRKSIKYLPNIIEGLCFVNEGIACWASINKLNMPHQTAFTNWKRISIIEIIAFIYMYIFKQVEDPSLVPEHKIIRILIHCYNIIIKNMKTLFKLLSII